MADSTTRLVAVRLPPGADFAKALRSVWGAGSAVLPLDTTAPRAQTEAALASLRPNAIVDDTGERPLPGGERVPAGTALVIATSGTTGEPKGVVLSHGALQASARATTRRLGLTRDDRWLACLPTHHIAGVMVFVRAWRAGHDPVILPRFDVEAVAAASATVVSLVPTMLVRLLDAGVDLSRWRRVLLGGAAATPDLLARARDAGAPVVVTYGMTETCGGCVYDGIPLDGVEVDVRDGRVALRGPVLCDGYRGGPSPLDPDGWLVTNDLGRLDARGRLEVLGRADGVIVSGGENVVAEHVEAVLTSHPGIAEVVVVGRPDPEWGEVAVAVIVADGTPPALAELQELARMRLGRAHAPHDLVVVPHLPYLASGKPDRAALRAQHRDR